MNKQNLPGSLFVELKSSGIIVSQMNKYELFFYLPLWLDWSGGMCQWAGGVLSPQLTPHLPTSQQHERMTKHMFKAKPCNPSLQAVGPQLQPNQRLRLWCSRLQWRLPAQHCSNPHQPTNIAGLPRRCRTRGVSHPVHPVCHTHQLGMGRRGEDVGGSGVVVALAGGRRQRSGRRGDEEERVRVGRSAKANRWAAGAGAEADLPVPSAPKESLPKQPSLLVLLRQPSPLHC